MSLDLWRQIDLAGGNSLFTPTHTPKNSDAKQHRERSEAFQRRAPLLRHSQPNDIMMKVEGRRSGLLMLQPPPPPAHVITADCSLECEDEDDDVFDLDGSGWQGEEEGAGTSDNNDKGSHRDDAEDDEHPPNNKRMKTPGTSSPHFSSSSSGVALSLEGRSKMEESDRACSLKENHPNTNESSPSWSPVLHSSSSSSLTSSASNNYSLFGFACSSVRHAWSAGSVIGAAAPHRSLPTSTYPPPFVIAATAMKSMADDVYDDDKEEEEEDDEDDTDEESDDDTHPPGMIPASSGENSDQSSDTSSEDDDDMGDVLLTEEDEDDLAAATLLANNNVAGGVPNPILRKGVTFNEQVRVLPIPPLQDYTPEQRYKMYANRYELRENKLRNKREYEFDKYDWRNVTEEHAMSVCPVSGELLHPVHL